jgi:molybdopterin-guanine dinucleotide biosynthesis protein A
MVDRAVAALRPHCAEVVVVSSRRDTPEGVFRRIEDLRPGLGPLAGIEAALRHAARGGYDAVVVLAVDLPLVNSDGVGLLLEAYTAPEAGAEGAVAASRAGDPDFEPLCAVYPSRYADAAADLLDRGERAARALFESVGGRRVASVSGAGANVNDASELDAAREIASGMAGGPATRFGSGEGVGEP